MGISAKKKAPISRILVSLVRSTSRNHGWNGSENQIEIPKKGSMANVVDIKTDPLMIGRIISSRNLPGACDARSYGEKSRGVRTHFLMQLLFGHRSRADHAEISFEDI